MIQFLRRGVQVIERGGLMTQEFERFLRGFWQEAGFDPKRAVYRNIEMHPIEVPSPATIDGDIEGPSFPNSTTTEMKFIGTVPNDYRDGTDIIPWVAWLPGNTNTGIVRWNLDHGIAGSGEVMSESSAIVGDDAASGTSLARQVKQMTAISGTGVRKGDSISATLQRLGSHASDTYNAAVILVGFGIKYKVDGIGTVAPFP